jgi:hypothetical protein
MHLIILSFIMHRLITKQLYADLQDHLSRSNFFSNSLLLLKENWMKNKDENHARWPRTRASDVRHAAETGRCRWRGNAKARAPAGQVGGSGTACAPILRMHAALLRAEMAQLLLPPVQRSWTASVHPCVLPVKLHRNSRGCRIHSKWNITVILLFFSRKKSYVGNTSSGHRKKKGED